MREQTNEPHEDILFEGIGEISEEDLLACEIEQMLYDPSLLPDNRREVQGSLGSADARNRFSISNPIPILLESFQEKNGQSFLAEIQVDEGKYDYCPFRLACSFVPAAGYRFYDACFEIFLQTFPAGRSTIDRANQEQALAYSLFPARVNDPVAHATHIAAFNPQGTRPGWQFTHTTSYRIDGYQELYLLVRKPSGTTIQATFCLTAHLQLTFGPVHFKRLLPTMMLFHHRNSSGTIIDPTVQLPTDGCARQNRLTKDETLLLQTKKRATPGVFEPEKVIQVFFSYSDADQDWLKRLENQLSLFVHEETISCWYSRHIEAGKERLQ